MSINVTVVCAFSNGSTKSLTLPSGSTVGAAASQVGAPSGCTYRVNGTTADATSPLGEGDMIIISMGKAAAG